MNFRLDNNPECKTKQDFLFRVVVALLLTTRRDDDSKRRLENFQLGFCSFFRCCKSI